MFGQLHRGVASIHALSISLCLVSLLALCPSISKASQLVANYTRTSHGQYQERQHPLIIRYRNYDMAQSFNEYKRKMVTLYIPFHNEKHDVLAEMKFIGIYDEHEQLILQRRKEFKSDLDIDKTIGI